MADKQLRVIIVGDAKSVQKAFQDTEQGAAKAEVKIEGFGKTFAKMGLAFEAGRMALDLFARTASAAVSAVGDYNSSLDLSERQLRGLTGSQQGANEALAVARAEADKGRGTYQELATAMAGLSTVAKTAGRSLQEVTETTEILAAINPEEGIKGATFALREAATGDFTSVIERFNLSRTTINRLKAEGVPAIDAVRQAMQEMGYDTKFLNEVNGSSAKQFELMKGQLTELAAVAGEPIFEALTIGIRRLNEAMRGGDGAGKGFVQIFADDLRSLLTGNIFNEIGISVSKLLVVMADEFSGFLKLISGGRLNIDGMVQSWKEGVTKFEAQIRSDARDKLAGAVAGEIEKTSKVGSEAAYKAGQDVVNSYLLGLSSGKIGDTQNFLKQFEDLFKDDKGVLNENAFKDAKNVIIQALQDIAAHGEITRETANKLSAAFGDQAINVAAMVNHYAAMTAAQDTATASSEQLAAAKKREQAALDQLTVRLRPYAQAVEAATQAAKDHADTAADAVEAVQRRLEDVGDAAATSARENAAALDALQDAAASHAAAYAAQEAAAQAELTEIQRRRREEAQDLYDTLVDGERRALDAAENRVNALSRKGNKEDLALLEQIKAARDAGDTKTAAALERRLKKQREGRRDEEELERARAQVARDEFDAADEQAKREVARLDAKIGKEEEAAQARLTAIQQGAKAQADADAAAIKGAQAAAKAEADRYAAQQRGIQAEIDRIQEAAKEQAKKDAAAITSAQTVYNNQKAINDKLALQIGFITGFAERQDAAAQRTAKATKDTLADDKERLAVAKSQADEMERQAAAAERIAKAQGVPVAPVDRGRDNPGGLPTTPIPPGGDTRNNSQRQSPAAALRAWESIRAGGPGI